MSCRHGRAIAIGSWHGSPLLFTPNEYVTPVAWCPKCGALGVWDETSGRRRWIKPTGASGKDGAT